MFARLLTFGIIVCMGALLFCGWARGFESPMMTNAILFSIFGFLIIRFCD